MKSANGDFGRLTLLDLRPITIIPGTVVDTWWAFSKPDCDQNGAFYKKRSTRRRNSETGGDRRVVGSGQSLRVVFF